MDDPHIVNEEENNKREEDFLLRKEQMTQELNKPIALIYNTLDNYNSVNLLFIDSQVKNYNDFYNNCNDNTFPIVYDYKSTGVELVELLEKFTEVNRIGFVFDELHLINKGFVDNLPFFNDNDLIATNINDISPNFKLLVDLCSRLNVKNIDFLACNSLNYDKWNKYYSQLKLMTNTEINESGCIIGASNDKTGNIKYGGDWILESTGQNIEITYFTDGIINYADTLSVAISFPVGSSYNLYIKEESGAVQYSTNSTSWSPILSWPFAISRTPVNDTPIKVFLNSDITINSNVSGYFECNTHDILFEGDGHKVTILDTTDYPGFIKNVSGVNTSYGNVTMQNIGIEASGITTLVAGGGWLCQTNFRNSTATNCYSTGPIAGGSVGYSGSGGIFGASCISSIATNCYSTGAIAGGSEYFSGSGGIFGAGCNTSIATNCYSTGDITGGSEAYSGSGGIFGAFCSSSTARNCYSTGPITGGNGSGDSLGSGGIFGANCISSIATNCYSTGAITGGSGSGSGYNSGSGGIFGADCDNSTARNCYSTGAINKGTGINSGSGGIFGADCDNSTANHIYTTGVSLSTAYYYYGDNCTKQTITYAAHSDSGWSFTVAITVLLNINPIPDPSGVWININPNNDTVPFLLYGGPSTYYNANFYSGSTESTIINTSSTNLNLSYFHGDYFWLLPTLMAPNVQIDNTTGQMTSSIPGTYIIYIINGNQIGDGSVINPKTIYGYNTITFTLIVPTIQPLPNLYILYKSYTSSSRKKSTKLIKKRIGKFFI
jgi:hypothetical protein